jgi:hypothetical protein
VTPEQIAQGGTVGLILALIAAVVFLARFAVGAYNDKKAEAADWKAMAQQSVAGFNEAVAENKRLTTAIETRNRIEEESLRQAREDARVARARKR